MVWDSNERDAWVADAERWIGDIVGVLQCKIDLDPEGEIAGIHVVAGMERDPRHIVRDVESLLKARLQLAVNYKKIGVVQVVENTNGVSFHPPADSAPQREEPTPAAAAGASDLEERPPIPAILVAEDSSPRIVCSGVGVLASDRVVRAEVQLRAGELEAGGTCEGTNHTDSDIDLVARATLDALSGLLAGSVLLHLREISVMSFGGQDVVLTAVELVEARRSETLFGACASRHNRQQAVVHSVLDALNRRLGLQALKEAAGEA